MFLNVAYCRFINESEWTEDGVLLSAKISSFRRNCFVGCELDSFSVVVEVYCALCSLVVLYIIFSNISFFYGNKLSIKLIILLCVNSKNIPIILPKLVELINMIYKKKLKFLLMIFLYCKLKHFENLKIVLML